jgi:hypothetical protein
MICTDNIKELRMSSEAIGFPVFMVDMNAVREAAGKVRSKLAEASREPDEGKRKALMDEYEELNSILVNMRRFVRSKYGMN